QPVWLIVRAEWRCRWLGVGSSDSKQYPTCHGQLSRSPSCWLPSRARPTSCSIPEILRTSTDSSFPVLQNSFAPNPRLQRTRMCAPLSRKPLGDGRSAQRIGLWALCLVVTFGCSSAHSEPEVSLAETLSL